MKKQMTGMVIIGQVNMETSMSEVVTDTRPTIKKAHSYILLLVGSVDQFLRQSSTAFASFNKLT